MNTTKDEIHIAGLNNATVKYDFEDFDEMDLVNVVTYLVMSISKYILQFFLLSLVSVCPTIGMSYCHRYVICNVAVTSGWEVVGRQLS